MKMRDTFKYLAERKTLTEDETVPVAPVMRNYSADKETGYPKLVLSQPDGSRQRPEDCQQALIDKIEVLCRGHRAELKVLQRAPVGFAIQVAKGGDATAMYGPTVIGGVVSAIEQLVRSEDAGAIVELMDSRQIGQDNPQFRQFTAVVRVLLRQAGQPFNNAQLADRGDVEREREVFRKQFDDE
jgi:hypothetical protein